MIIGFGGFYRLKKKIGATCDDCIGRTDTDLSRTGRKQLCVALSGTKKCGKNGRVWEEVKRKKQ